MTFDTDTPTSMDRSGFRFPEQVHAAFGFLNSMGFTEVEVLPTLVRYQNKGLEVEIFHGRRSYEVDAGITGHGVRYSIAEVVEVDGPGATHKYRPRVARTPDALAPALEELCRMMKIHGARALGDDPMFFSMLARHRDQWAKDLELDVLARQLRPKAEEAFRLGHYEFAANLYGRFRARLTPAEAKKLAIAESRQIGKIDGKS